MNWKPIAATVALLASGAWTQSAGAVVVLSDDFGVSGAQSNWAGDGVFQSTPQPGNAQGLPSVDLVGPGYFQNLAYAGNSVDLDGTTGNGHSPAGELQSVASLATGNYTLQFMLAGNLRGAPAETTTISIGGQSYALTPSNSAPYTLETLYFTGASGHLTFVDSGPSDQQGNLLDNVVLTTGVPEPATWAMMLIGFGGLGAALRAARRKQAVASAV